MLNFSSQARHDSSAVALREKLMSKVDAENENFNTLMQDFEQLEERDSAATQAVCEEIVAMVDRVLAVEGWQDSLFLRNLMKPLQSAKEEAQELLAVLNHDPTEEVVAQRETAEDEIVLYMTLYQAQGLDLASWNLQLRSIKHTMLGRPMYATEESALAVVRSRVDQSCDAYVVLCIKKACIMDEPESGPKMDKNNNELVVLEQGSVSTSSILEFVYMNKRYLFKEGSLSLQVR